jgi:hypothetical protein
MTKNTTGNRIAAVSQVLCRQPRDGLTAKYTFPDGQYKTSRQMERQKKFAERLTA